MGEETLLEGIDGHGVGAERKGRVLGVDLDLRRRERGFEAVGDAEIVGAERHGVAAREVEANLVVVIGKGRRPLANGRVDVLVHASTIGGEELRGDAELLVIDVEGQGRAREQRLAVERHVVSEAVAHRNRHLEPAVRGAQPLDAIGGRARRRGHRRYGDDS